MPRILTTGGAGFVGHHFVEHFLKTTDWEIVVLDKLNNSGSLDRLRDIDAFDDKRVLTLTADFTQPIEDNLAREIGEVDYIFHLGAESHVDNSIADPVRFVRANVEGTTHVLNFARTLSNLKMFYYFSTDEVFGSIDEGFSKEEDQHNPKNPYAATKSGGEMMVKAFGNTYGIPYIITRSMNIFGERQHPEKFIPLCIRQIRDGGKLYIHANSELTQAGIRSYIHARNVADAYDFLIEHGQSGQEYNIVGEKEVDNLELAQTIADIMGKPLNYELVDFHSSRPGHDLRYALDGSKLAALGWQPPKSFETSLQKTIDWTLSNSKWL